MLKKAIAVVTSGGDSPGMNAAARAVVRTALYEGVDVYGVHNGYSGMVHDDIEQLTSRSVSDLIQRGGTFLGTARSKTFMTPEGRKTAYENLRKRNIEGLVIIGGDGSLTGGSLLSKETGMPIVGLPGTIDNDVWGMDYTIGCDTACNTIVDAINKLRDTASAHRRIIIVEVMGRQLLPFLQLKQQHQLCLDLVLQILQELLKLDNLVQLLYHIFLLAIHQIYHILYIVLLLHYHKIFLHLLIDLELLQKLNMPYCYLLYSSTVVYSLCSITNFIWI